ncbi:MAG: family 16 glycoside hydrolase [Opitutaceae bacterium]
MRTVLGLIFAASLTLPATAAAQLARRGALLLQEDFQRHAVYTKERLPVQPGWQVRVAHGVWTRTPGGVRSTWEQGHSPVLVYEGAFGDVIIEVDFRFQSVPGQWAACRVSATNPTLFPRGYAASVWANVDFKSRGRGFLIENDVWDGPITRVAYKKADYVADTWYTLRLELVGNQAVAECNGIRATGTHDKFGLPKTSIWLATGQSPHDLRNLRVYAAERNPDWPPKDEKKP